MPGALSTLKQRKDFLACARGRRMSTPGFLLQGRLRGDDSPAMRVGFTCSKKVGNAVARNRAKRRLREIARSVLPNDGKSGWDYVLVGFQNSTATRTFAKMERELGSALERLHLPRKSTKQKR